MQKQQHVLDDSEVDFTLKEKSGEETQNPHLHGINIKSGDIQDAKSGVVKDIKSGVIKDVKSGVATRAANLRSKGWFKV
jgi:hypothetical protein